MTGITKGLLIGYLILLAVAIFNIEEDVRWDCHQQKDIKVCVAKW